MWGKGSHPSGEGGGFFLVRVGGIGCLCPRDHAGRLVWSVGVVVRGGAGFFWGLEQARPACHTAWCLVVPSPGPWWERTGEVLCRRGGERGREGGPLEFLPGGGEPVVLFCAGGRRRGEVSRFSLVGRGAEECLFGFLSCGGSARGVLSGFLSLPGWLAGFWGLVVGVVVGPVCCL